MYPALCRFKIIVSRPHGMPNLAEVWTRTYQAPRGPKLTTHPPVRGGFPF
jgi:hypothetical protein